MLHGAHVAGRPLFTQDVPSFGSSLSLRVLPFRRPVSVVAVEIVAMVLGTGRKPMGLRVIPLSSPSASATAGEVETPFLNPTSFCSVTGGCFPDVLTGLVAITWVATAFGAGVVKWWKSSLEHERAGILQKVKQTKPFTAWLSSYHQTAFLWSLNEGFCRHKSYKIAHGHKHSEQTGCENKLESQSQSKIHCHPVINSYSLGGLFLDCKLPECMAERNWPAADCEKAKLQPSLLRVREGRRPHFLTSWGV